MMHEIGEGHGGSVLPLDVRSGVLGDRRSGGRGARQVFVSEEMGAWTRRITQQN